MASTSPFTFMSVNLFFVFVNCFMWDENKNKLELETWMNRSFHYINKLTFHYMNSWRYRLTFVIYLILTLFHLTQLIADCTNQLKAETANFMLLSKRYEGKTDCVEPWYQTQYSVEDVPRQWMERIVSKYLREGLWKKLGDYTAFVITWFSWWPSFHKT